MSAALVLAGVAAGAFVSTNVDAFLLLVANEARAPRSRGAAAGGFLVATALVVAVSWAVASASRLVPAARVGLVGIVPLGIGIKQGIDILRKRAAGAAAGEGDAKRARVEDSLRLGEALVLHLALSADNLAVYSSLLSDTLPPLRPVIVATTLVLAVAWAALARLAIRLPLLSGVLLRFGHGLMAVLLVAVGSYILVDTDTDVLEPPRPPVPAIAP